MIRAASFTLLVIILVVWKPGVTSTQGPPSQKNEPSPPAEVKGPIIAIMIASSIDEKGNLVSPGFTFPQNEPQITAVVWVGKIKDSQLKVAWYKTSEDGDEKLFDHQIQVKSDDRAFSIARNPGPLFLAGTYKIVATLEGQTQEIEFDISPRKTAPKKTSTSRGAELFEDRARSRISDRTLSVGTNGWLAEDKSGLVAGVGGNIQKVSWDAASRTVPATQSGSASAQGKRPVAGSSGAAPQPTGTLTGPSASDCKVFVGAFGDLNNHIWQQAHLVKVVSYAFCPKSFIDRTSVYPRFDVFATVTGTPRTLIFTYVAGYGVVNGDVFSVSPCYYSGGSDLPGTTIALEANSLNKINFAPANAVITLGDDTFAPRVKVISTPARGTTVKAGDKINLKVIATEQKSGESWQTGVKVIQVTAIPGGLVKDWVNPSNLPKPCAQKTWEQNLDATYTVPSSPPPTIKICAIAEDYQGNESSQCGEFNTTPENVMPANCRSKGYAKVGQTDGTPLLHDENKVTCRIDWSICGTFYKKTTVVDNRSGACESFFNSVKASLPKEPFCCDCYPKCGAQRKSNQ